MSVRPSGDAQAAATVAPVQPQERLGELDVLRGFTLVGVLLVNVSDYTRNSHQGLDPWWYQTLGAATGGKFATLFQLMFGIGFAIQMDRWRGPESHQAPRYIVRCAILFLIGWAAEFIGAGLIVSVYAMTALGMLFFRKASARTVLIWAVIFAVLSSSNAFEGASSRINAWRDRDAGTAVLRQQRAKEARTRISALVRESRADSASFFRSRSLWIQANLLRFRAGALLPSAGVFALFLLGLFLWRNRAVTFAADRSRGQLVFTILAIAIGLAGQMWSANHAEDAGVRSDLILSLQSGARFVTRTLLSLGYGSAVVMLYRAGVLARLWSLLAWQGRMGLSVFILQNFILVWIWSSWGLGLQNLSYRWDIPLTVVITAALVVLCRAWLDRFRWGPAEWLWRTLTYRFTTRPARVLESVEPVIS